MRRNIRRKALVALLLATVAGGFGCNPLLAPAYFLGIFNNTTMPPDFEFYQTAKAAKKKREIKIVILPEKGSHLSPDFFGSEHNLAKAFETKLAGYFAATRKRSRSCRSRRLRPTSDRTPTGRRGSPNSGNTLAPTMYSIWSWKCSA